MQLTQIFKNRNRPVRALSFSFLVILFFTAVAISAFARLPGDLDPTFSGDGKLTDWSGGANSVAIQPDGKIVVAGNDPLENWFSNSFQVARYNSDGSVDTTFGGGTGKVIVQSGGSAGALAIQGDGKIVIGGLFYRDGGLGDSALVRLNTNGSFDTTFGSAGVVTRYEVSNARVVSMVIQQDGKIVAALGRIADGGFIIRRHNPDGSLDTSFDDDGIVHTFQNTGAVLLSIALQTDGKLVAAGGWDGKNFPTNIIITRYNPNGSLDTSFDGDGVVETGDASFGEACSVTIQGDGKIVAASSNHLVRHNANGSLDSTFGTGGVVIEVFSPGDYYSGPNTAVAIQADGKLVVSGGGSDFSLFRYNQNGSPDTTFGGGDGRATVDFNNSPDYARGMALDSEGRAVVVGESDGMFAIARVLLGQRPARFDFDGDGRSDISVFRPSDRIWYLDQSTAGYSATQFGVSTDKIAPADFDGDGKTDIAIFRDGAWWRINSSDSTVVAQSFGIAGDVPVPADYTGDGRDELAVYRNGQWWALDLSNDQPSLINFGLATDIPVPADYDGDGRVDQAVYRDGEWYLNRSLLGYADGPFGLPSDRPVVGDYDGDGRADLAVYRNGTWYLLQSTAQFAAFQWGLSTDVPAPADYDGDGKTDAAVYRDGVWYLLQSTGGIGIGHFGLAGDKPTPSAFVPSP